jgi:hypothetical protein
MRNNLIPLLFVLLLPGLAILTSFVRDKKAPVRHVVVFKYKPNTTEQQIQQVTDAFKGLQKTIPGIVSFEFGTNNSPENKNQGFTHVYLLTFEDAAARDTYLPHPKHKEFGQLLGKLGVVEDAFVVDFTPNP